MPYSDRGGNINTKDRVVQWLLENGGKSKGVLGWAISANPYRPDTYLDIEHVAWKNVQIFIGECEGPDGNRVLDIAFLLNTNFPVEEKYEETLLELQQVAGPDFMINDGYSENLEMWMSYFEAIDGFEKEIEGKVQRASELAVRLAKIASGMLHIPQINLR